MDKVVNLIILGPQGSGKGTQAELLRKKLDAVFFSAGDLLREIAREDTELGRKVHQTINVEGRLVEPELVSEVFRKKILGVPGSRHLILDGYPRSMAQFALLQKFWPELKRGEYTVLYIDLSEAEALKRLALRKRLDDEPDAIKKRLELFYSETLPMIKEMEKAAAIIRINGEQSVENVQKEVLEKLKLR